MSFWCYYAYMYMISGVWRLTLNTISNTVTFEEMFMLVISPEEKDLEMINFF